MGFICEFLTLSGILPKLSGIPPGIHFVMPSEIPCGNPPELSPEISSGIDHVIHLGIPPGISPETAIMVAVL